MLSLMLKGLMRWLIRGKAAALRLWRLSSCRVCGYRLRSQDGESRVLDRIVDTRLIGEHIFMTDIDGRTYTVALSSVSLLVPIDLRPAASTLQPIQVVG